MGQLLAFLYKYRAFFTFLILELLCVWLIVANNNYQRATYFKVASGFVGSINQTTDNIEDFFSLRRVNEELAAENAMLRQLLLKQPAIAVDSLQTFEIKTDSTDTIEYELRMAEIIDNSVRQSNNFFMIDKGRQDGIKPGMGVINQNGVVGKIVWSSKRFSSGISVLNSRNQISAEHKNSGRFGTIQWDGDSRNAKQAKLLYITRDVNVQIGDTIWTSGFNAVYPKYLMIGTVASVTPDSNQRDLDIAVNLSVDFGKLAYVYVIENVYRQEIDSLSQINPLDFQ